MPLGVSPSTAFPERRRRQPSPVAQLDDAVTHLEPRTDQRRLDRRGTLPGSAAVVALQQDQVHLRVAEIVSVHEPQFRIVPIRPTAETEQRPVGRARNTNRMGGRPVESLLEQSHRVGPRLSVVRRSREVRSVVERFDRLSQVEGHDQFAVVQQDHRRMPGMDCSKIWFRIAVNQARGSALNHSSSFVRFFTWVPLRR